MSARFTPLIFLCRMAVYGAALLVLATARLPDLPSAEGAALMRRAADAQSPRAESGARLDAPEPAPDALGIRVILAAVLVLGVLAEARRPSWP